MEETAMTVAVPESADELIVIKQLPIIQEQLRQIKSKVDDTVAEVLSMECTEDTVKTIKDKRAKLNQMATSFEERRKEVKKSVLAPYEAFEAVYKECVIDAFRAADAELKTRIAAVEDSVKSAKESEVLSYYTEYAESLNLDYVSFRDMRITVRLSDSIKKMKEQVKTTLDKIYADAGMISTMQDADEIMTEFKRNGYDAANAVLTVTNRHIAIEEEKKRAEERRQAEAARLEAERQAKERYEQLKKEEAAAMPQNEPIQPPVSVEVPVEQKPVEDGNGGSVKFSEPVETYSATFTVFGTIEQLKAVKTFLNNGGYKYECE